LTEAVSTIAVRARRYEVGTDGFDKMIGDLLDGGDSGVESEQSGEHR
jgi:hypothetical protein